MNLAGRFVERIAEWGDRPAIHEPRGGVISYAELRRRILGFARVLKARGFKPGDAAVIQVPVGASFTTSSVAASLLGGVMVLCEPGFGDEIYVSRLRAARSNWALVHPAVLWANRMPGARRLLRRRGILVPPVLPDSADLRRVMVSPSILAKAAAAAGADPVPEDVPPRSDLGIIFTGGTTGAPKGVRISHESALQFLQNIAVFAQDTGTKTLIADNPQQVLFGLTFGYEVFVAQGPVPRRATQVRQLIEGGRAGAYFGAPYLWVEMMQQAGPAPRRLPASLRAVFLGGAPVTPEFLQRLRGWLHPETKVTAIYGATEAGPVAWASAEEKASWTEDGDYVGRIVPNTEVRIAEDGEIVVRGLGLFTGYIGQPELAPDEGFATGDLGHIVERNGQKALVLLGRAKDMIIRAGINIYPSTLEAGLRALQDQSGQPLLREVALIGLWDVEKQDEAVVLCWQPWSGVAIDEAELMRRVLAVTGDNARPDHLMKVDAMPIVGRLGKVDKRTLRQAAAARFRLGESAPASLRR